MDSFYLWIAWIDLSFGNHCNSPQLLLISENALYLLRFFADSDFYWLELCDCKDSSRDYRAKTHHVITVQRLIT